MGLFKLKLGEVLAPLRFHGQDIYVNLVTEEIVSLAMQLHENLMGVDRPYYVNYNKLGIRRG